MSWVIAHAFNSDLGLVEMFVILRERTGQPWRERDSDLWSEYISAVVSEAVVHQENDKIQPLIGARDVRRAPANN